MISNRMKNLHPYVPGEQPKDRVYIKLNANENPYPPDAKVVQAVSDFVKNNPMRLALYPDPDSLELHAAIDTGGVLCNAEVSGEETGPSEKDRIPFKVTSDMIYSGNGSDEVLSFVFYAFFDSGKKLVLPEFTYSFYPVYAGFYDIATDIVPMKKDWQIQTRLAESDWNALRCVKCLKKRTPTGFLLLTKPIAISAESRAFLFWKNLKIWL